MRFLVPGAGDNQSIPQIEFLFPEQLTVLAPPFARSTSADPRQSFRDPSRMYSQSMRRAIALASAQGCGKGSPAQEALQAEAAEALDALVAELVAERPSDAAAYAERLHTYLEAHPAFYGSAAALLDESGTVTASPYIHRTANGYRTLDLARPQYDIQAQDWLTMPLAADAGIWTRPYFDAGGGEIWMITRSVPARDGEHVFAIVTTDLPVDAPGERPPNQSR